ncbi:MAG: 3'(2'),5'-bisphosphate nucleotidase CysQ [Methylobacteriaceae bacterium]|jgi:3'(2'), 5'-bisphosphate nucleotidase|nr:3'(2'),5'-bisphosphate nucleotidase CysQ [Methylobacteriaceae bacterium]
MILSRSSADSLSEELAGIAVGAGRLLRTMRRDIGSIRYKEDGSPVTDADKHSEALILDMLSQAFPQVPVVSEERETRVGGRGFFFLVDPLDGTRDYIRPEGEYTVNIALIEDGTPVAAAIAAPETDDVWIAGETARTARLPDGAPPEWKRISARKMPAEGGVALVSRRHRDDEEENIMAALPIIRRRVASSAVKFCWLAEGQADVYIRCRPTMEWDTAAGGLILERAGGVLFGSGGEPLPYGRTPGDYRSGAFAALGDPAFKPRVRLPASIREKFGEY